MIVSFLSAAVGAGIPLLLATLGAINCEKVGNLNLGIEGIMIVGAFGSFYAGYLTDSPAIALICGMCASVVITFIYALLTITFRTSHAVTGLTLTIFGVSLANTLGKPFAGVSLGEGIQRLSEKVAIPILGDIPIIGDVLFNQDIVVYIGYLLTFLFWIYYTKTQFGLNLKAVGENPNAADAAGISIEKYKYMNVLLGGAICGLAGAYLSTVIVGGWQEGITASRGWIAIALVVFSSWKPQRALLGAYLFGSLSIIGFYISIPVSQYLLASLPYLFTILILIILSNSKKYGANVPKSLGDSYFREKR